MVSEINRLEEQYWFHSNLSDEDSKQILTKDGDFLQRKIKNKDLLVPELAADEEINVTSTFLEHKGHYNCVFRKVSMKTINEKFANKKRHV